MSKLEISDLLSAFANTQPTNQNNDLKSNKKTSKATEEFLVQGNMKVKQIKKSE